MTARWPQPGQGGTGGAETDPVASAAVASEQARATAAEAQEADARAAADAQEAADRAAAIADEAQARADDVDTEEARAEAAEAAEQARALAAEAAEQQRAVAAEATKQEAATAATDAELAAQRALLDAADATEQSARSAADTAEATTRQQAIQSLLDSVSAEVAARQSGDALLQTIARIDGASHSGMIGGYTGGSDNSYFKKLARAFGARKCGWLSAGGSVACWPTANAGTDGGYSWVLNMFRPPNSGDGTGGYMPQTNMAVIHHGAEDLFALGSQTLKPFTEALKTEISRYCTAALYEDNDPSWTYSAAPAWPAPVGPGGQWDKSGGSLHFTQTVGCYAEWTVPTDYPGNLVVAFGLTVIPGAVGNNSTVTVGITVDGVPQPDYVINHDKGGHADAENGKTNGIVVRMGRADCGTGIRLGPEHAGKKIRLTYKTFQGGGAPYFGIDYAQIEADPLDGPLVVLPSGFWRIPSYAGKFTVAQGWKHGSDAAVDPLNDAAVLALIEAQKSVMADFPGRCVYVDLDGAINKDPAWLASDGIHPSNRGHSLIARTVIDAIKKSGLLTSRVASSVGQRVLGPFDGGVWRTIGGVYGTGANQRALLNGWVAYSAASQFPSYMVGALDGRQRARGWLKQGGAGAAGSAMFTQDTGSVPSSLQGSQDLPLVCYTGAAWATWTARVDTEAAVLPRQVFAVSGGQIGAGSAMILNGLEWPAEA